jgi:hypothetical protein
MEFVVRFSVENAAFDDDRSAGIAGCLAEVTRMIDAGRQHGKIWDANGNVIGEFGLEED